jgi:Fe-S-cluster-containing dehydrogenase component
MHYLPVLCQHCDNAPCIKACPVKGALYKREDGLVIIDAEKCTGCKNCVDICPWGKIYFNEDLNLAQKCTGCAHLLDGEGGKEVPKIPRCVDACPTEALKLVEETEVKKLAAQAKTCEVVDPRTLNGIPEYSAKPRVYYLNIPKKFIAGTVYDPIAKEIIKGAACTLKNGTKSIKKETDGFGDFWFEGLAEGTYSLAIEANGFPTKTIKAISTEKDVNLGDIALG